MAGFLARNCTHCWVRPGAPCRALGGRGRQALDVTLHPNHMELIAKIYHKENIQRPLSAAGGLHLPD
ncbi:MULTISPECIES: zinc finger domain-containing protein [Pseudomonas]|uniref:zinc finger domain-containing protein n=1 Tax=Pseudomonas TaxID=286 RepID=UPI003B838DB2